MGEKRTEGIWLSPPCAVWTDEEARELGLLVNGTRTLADCGPASTACGTETTAVRSAFTHLLNGVLLHCPVDLAKEVLSQILPQFGWCAGLFSC